MHIPKEKRHKLEEKTEKGIFLGYSSQSKGYRVYSLKTKKLIISRDVEFDEHAAWNLEDDKVEKRTIMVPRLRETSQDEAEEEEGVQTPQTTTPQSSPRSTPSSSSTQEYSNSGETSESPVRRV